MSTTLKPNRSDSAALYVAIAFGVGAAVWTIIHAIERIAVIVTNRDVPITASFVDTPATLPIGPGGADVPVVVEQVVFQTSGMPGITIASLLLAEIVFALAVLVTITCVCLVIRNLIRGRAFDRSTVGLVGTATLTVAIGWVLTSLFTTMAANGGTSALSGGAADNTLMQVDPVFLFGIGSLGALTVAFQAGARLQKDTEGLV